ncbi:chorismate mutase [Candidatus Peregrinibacteria bacterium]|nr:chorismate mutase [Candidatus Peregrinibacteria bacterium]
MKKSSQYESKNKEASEKIEVYRKKIDTIDAKIVDLLSKRINLILKIGAIKNSLNLPIRSASREQKLLQSLKLMANKKKIPAELIKKVYNQILSSSRKLQERTKSQV